MTYFLLSPKGIDGGESSLPKMHSILMCRAEQCIAQLGIPLSGGRPPRMVEVSILEEHLLTDIEVAFREAYKQKSPSGLG
ncbi:hypothetical protein DIKCMJMK_04396 [Shewanella oneidensis]|nr:hypothetical protein [Shewanella oneidensis]